MNTITHSGEELQSIYKARFDGRFEYRKKIWSVLVRDFYQQFVRVGDTVLDLGAGYCEFINQVTCAKKYAMDLNPETVLQANKDVTVISHDCSEVWPLPDKSLDVVFTSNFFEHLSDTEALTRTIKEIERCLKPSGRLIAMGPNIKYAGGAYWDYIDHHIPLTELSLAEAFVQNGFTIEKCVDKFLPFTMASGPHYPTFFVSAYLHLPLAWRILGKQFLVIARKSN